MEGRSKGSSIDGGHCVRYMSDRPKSIGHDKYSFLHLLAFSFVKNVLSSKDLS